MRRFLTPPIALLAGLAILLSGCAGESPTSPSTPPGGGGGGPCNVTITLAATSVTPLEGTAVIIRATVKRSGAAVPDGTSVLFTTDFGFFLETGLNSVSKVTVGGFADVTLASLASGASHVRASLECASTPLTIEFAPVPQEGPFVSSIFPNVGTCLGGDTVVINGGKFGTDITTTRVTFGGVPATVVTVTDNQIVVRTPARTLANPAVPEVVDVVVSLGVGTAGLISVTYPRGFTYQCIDPNQRIFISSVVPNNGRQEGGDIVQVNGGNFGNSIATTRVTFGGVSASILSMSQNVITVSTPRHINANPTVPETVDVAVTIDLGLVSQQSAVLPRAFTYRAIGPAGQCDTSPALFISSISPNSGSPNGGDVVAVRGGGFGLSAATTRVDFGGVPGQVTSVSDTQIIVTTPRRTLANPNVSEVVDIKVTVDVGGPNEACATLARAFTFRGSGGGGPICNVNPALFISSITPNTGSPDGGDLVTISGGGFGTTIATSRVEFGGVPAQIQSVGPNSIVVATPRRTLADPFVPESVDLRVTVDVGGPNEACATLSNAFTYTRIVLVPQIFSTSPRVGPNDTSTRVTIFGDGFQFPMQVLVRGADCISPIEATVVSVKVDQIVFLTPIALQGNNCLQGSVVDIQVLNPTTGQTATCTGCFKYYDCPTLNGGGQAFPAVAPYNQTTTVVINGQNFEEPVQATFAVAGRTLPLNVTSVSSSGIAIQMPPIDPLQFGGGGCTDVAGNITLHFLNLSCGDLGGIGFRYQVTPITLASASPTSLNQNGSVFGGPLDGPPAVITVTGTNFTSPVTVALVGPGGAVVSETTTNNAQVGSNGTTLTFPAPAIRDILLNTQACSLAGNVIGTQYVSTSFGIRVTNAGTGCSATLPNVLVYNPNDTTCRAAPIVVTTTLPNAALCASYGPEQLEAVGGNPPYTWTAENLPFGLTLDPATGQISGTPALSANGTGVANQIVAVTVTLTDASTPPQTATRVITLLLTDAGAPFQITGQSTQTIGAAGGATTPFTASPDEFDPITWNIDAINPPVAGITLANTTGTTTALNVAATVPGGSYVVTLRATDNACGAFHHTNTIQVTINKAPGNLVITSGAPASGTLCVAYGTNPGFTLTAAGGTLPYSFSATGLPNGLTLNPTTGVLSGTPQLSASGAGGDIIAAVTFTVSDSSGTVQTASVNYNLLIDDPNGPFSVTGTSPQSIPGGGGTTSAFVANPNPTPSGFSPVTWTIDSISPTVAGIGFVDTLNVNNTLTTVQGQTAAIRVLGTVPFGVYDLVIRATAAGCGTFRHSATFPVTLNVTGGPLIIGPDTQTLPPATLCVSYGGPGSTLTAVGGTPPYSWSVVPGTEFTQLPVGLDLNVIGQTAQITGIPTLRATGEGGNLVYTITFQVTDSSVIPQTSTRTYNLGVEDPDGPFVIVGNGAQSFPLGVITDGSTLSAMVNKSSPTVPTWTPIYWSLTAAPAGITIVGSDGGNPTSGLTAVLHSDGTLAAGQYNVTVRAEDSPPCLSPSNPGVRHRATFTVIVTIVGP